MHQKPSGWSRPSSIICRLQCPEGRPVHTIGVGVKGEFVASDVARTYCIAEHFNGHPVEVSMRFSNGLGGLGAA